jgi:hypothetical protein
VGCGGDDASSSAHDAVNQVQQTADQARSSGDRPSAADLAESTRNLADQIVRSARELSNNPQADVDQRLRDAERRAGELADQAQRTDDAELSANLNAANQRLVAAAAKLQDAQNADGVRAAFKDDLGPAVDRLTQAANAVKNDKGAQRTLERARDQLDDLANQLPDLAG